MDYRTYIKSENNKEEAVEFLKTCEKPIEYYLEVGNTLTTSTNLTNEEASELVATDDLIIKVVEYKDCVEIVKKHTFTGTYRNEIKERGLLLL